MDPNLHGDGLFAFVAEGIEGGFRGCDEAGHERALVHQCCAERFCAGPGLGTSAVYVDAVHVGTEEGGGAGDF
jgi:hypothetical protein